MIVAVHPGQHAIGYRVSRANRTFQNKNGQVMAPPVECRMSAEDLLKSELIRLRYFEATRGGRFLEV